MIAEDCSITRLMGHTHRQVRRAHVLFDRVSANLTAMQAGREEDAEGGWRRYSIQAAV